MQICQYPTFIINLGLVSSQFFELKLIRPVKVARGRIMWQYKYNQPYLNSNSFIGGYSNNYSYNQCEGKLRLIYTQSISEVPNIASRQIVSHSRIKRILSCLIVPSFFSKFISLLSPYSAKTHEPTNTTSSRWNMSLKAID